MKGELQLTDTANLFLVRVDRDRRAVVLIRPESVIPGDHALNLAAWIVVLVEPECKEFNPLLEAIKKS